MKKLFPTLFLLPLLLFTLTLSLSAQEDDPFAELDLPGIGSKAAPADDPDTAIQGKVIQSHTAVKAGETFVVGLELDIRENFHIQSIKPANPESIPTTFALVNPPEGFTQGELDSTPTKTYEPTYITGAIQVYKNKALLALPIKVSSEQAPGKVTLNLAAMWQSCDLDNCYAPLDTKYTITIEVAEGTVKSQAGFDLLAPFLGTPFKATAPIEQGEAPAKMDDEAVAKSLDDIFKEAEDNQAAAQAQNSEADSAATGDPAEPALNIFGLIEFETDSVLIYMLIAFLVGVILNFTPCVLPVIPIKVMSLVQHGGSRAKTIKLGIVFSLGIIATFVFLGMLVTAFKMVWGQQFSNWEFTLAMGVIMFVFSLSMFDVFTFRLPSKVYMVQPKMDSYSGSFMFGILTAVLSTPCTGPLFGGTMSWALQQSNFMTYMVFIVMGIGMAAPYMILVAYPKGIDKLPKSGPSGVLLKQVLGLLMIAVALWFAGTAMRAMPEPLRDTAHWWAIALVVIVTAGWLIYQCFKLKINFVITAVLAMLFLGLAGFSVHYANKELGTREAHYANLAKQQEQLENQLVQLQLQQTGGAKVQKLLWQKYKVDLFEQAKKEHIVVLEFTADWCANCKVLERTTLSQDSVIDRISQDDVITFKADLTGRASDPRYAEGWKKLSELGRIGIPLTAVYHPGKDQPILLDSIYAPSALLNAIDGEKHVSK